MENQEISKSIEMVAKVLDRLGNNNVAANIGAVELLSAAINNLADAIRDSRVS